MRRGKGEWAKGEGEGQGRGGVGLSRFAKIWGRYYTFLKNYA